MSRGESKLVLSDLGCHAQLLSLSCQMTGFRQLKPP